jgi:Protein of unknown function (DUF3489)
MPWMLLGNTATAAEHEAKRAAFRKDGLTMTRYWLARSASSAVALMPVATRRRCPHFRWVATADWPSTSGDIFKSLPGSRKSLSRHTFRSTSPAREALLSVSTAPSWVAARLAPNAGLVVVQASRRAVRIQRMMTMASKQPRKQAKSAAQADIDEANQPARDRQRTPRRRTQQARSKSTANQTGEAAAPAPASSRGPSKSIGRSKITTLPPEDPASQSDRIAEGVNLAMAKMPDADRPRASTKRAVLIGMLERPEGASVAEIGQRLGWLPHTVRAAFTGLRHAGREVTRSKDATGQSVYRLALVEIAPNR